MSFQAGDYNNRTVSYFRVPDQSRDVLLLLPQQVIKIKMFGLSMKSLAPEKHEREGCPF